MKLSCSGLQSKDCQRLNVLEPRYLIVVGAMQISKADEQGKRVIDVTKLGALERRVFIDKLLKEIEADNHRLLHKLKERIDR